MHLAENLFCASLQMVRRKNEVAFHLICLTVAFWICHYCWKWPWVTSLGCLNISQKREYKAPSGKHPHHWHQKEKSVKIAYGGHVDYIFWYGRNYAFWVCSQLVQYFAKKFCNVWERLSYGKDWRSGGSFILHRSSALCHVPLRPPVFWWVKTFPCYCSWHTHSANT